jgi:rRNA biogenesis protein RRP5
MAPMVEKKRKIAPTNESLSKRLRTTEDEPFPRGGASLLTPLEHKQINIEAKRDVLFEQQGESKDENEPAKKSKFKSKGKEGKEGKAKKGSKKTNVEPEDETVKIEGLSYKVRCYDLHVTRIHND